MKTKFYLLTLLLAASIGHVWGETATMTWGTTGTGYNVFSATSGTITNVLDFSTAKNDATTAPAYNSTNKQLRLYYNSKGNGGSITLTPKTGVTITAIKVYSATKPTLKYKIASGSYTAAGTWSGSSSPYTSNNTGLSVGSSSSITFINANTTNTQLQITQIDVTYTTSAGSTYTVVIADSL